MNILSTVSNLVRRLGIPHERFISMSKTLRSGEALIAGDVKIELLDRKRGERSVMVSVGGGLAVLLNLDDRDGLPVQCYSDGTRIPTVERKAKSVERKDERPAPHAQRPTVLPLCRLGPGGDYVRDWPPEKTVDHEAKSGERNDERPTPHASRPTVVSPTPHAPHSTVVTGVQPA